MYWNLDRCDITVRYDRIREKVSMIINDDTDDIQIEMDIGEVLTLISDLSDAAYKIVDKEMEG